MIQSKRHTIFGLIVCILVVQWAQNLLIINWNRHEDGVQRNQQNEPSLPHRPVFIYHPGPPKMGTSSLQCALLRNQVLLAEDGYIFAGKIPKKFCPSKLIIACSINANNEEFISQSALECLTNLTCQHAAQKSFLNKRKHTSWEKLTRQLHRISYRQPNATTMEIKGLILSDETHSMFHEQPALSMMPRHITETLFSNDTNWIKHLVVGYRWYWQFWLSSRHEYNRLFTKGAGRKAMQAWNGRHLKSLTVMLREEIVATNSYMSPHTLSVLNLYGQFFDKVTILNLHDEPHRSGRSTHDGDFVRHFMCDILDDAPQTCQSYKAAARFNPATNTDAADMDRLVMEAASRGWINTTQYTRWFAVNETLLENHAHRGILAGKRRLVMMCPSKQELTVLLQKSLEEEERIFNLDTMEQRQMRRSGHIRQFWQASFCALDVHQTLLEDDTWQEFFLQRFT